MSERRQVVLLRLAAFLGGASAVITSVAGIGTLGFVEWYTGFSFFLAVYALFFAVFTWLVAPRQPRNPVVWVMAASAFFGGIVEYGYVAASLLYDVDLELLTGNELTPASLPTPAASVVMVFSWAWIPALLPQVTFGLLLFPDGKLPSPRWRWLGVLAAVGILAATVASAWSYRPSNTALAEDGLVFFIGFMLVALAAVLSLAALVTRFRRSSGDARHQIKWVLWGTSIFILVFMGFGFVLGGTEYEYLLLWPITVAEIVFLGSYGIAVGKYRLYDIDIVISKTLVYSALAVLITAMYVGIVVGLGLIFGTGDQTSIGLGIAATVAIAIAFQPLRRLLQKIANRLVYGRRATPYEVLSSFSQRLAAVDPDVLGQVAQSLTEGTTAVSAVIWIRRGSALHRIACWPGDQDIPEDIPVDGEIPGADRVAEVIHDGDRLGIITLGLPAGQTFPHTDTQLLEQVSSGLGLALRNLLLTDDLRARVDQLRDSRRRVVALQDQTRQMLERDLHDGAQQRLVALKIKVGIGAAMAEKEELADIKDILDTVKEETDLTVDSLRTLARGIYPPLLEAEGLGSALTSQLQRAPLPVTVQAAGIERYPREVEATVYFCVLEAVQNAIKYAQAHSVLVTLSNDEGGLSFEVRDDGLGFTPTANSDGQGLTNVGDRLDALGGTLELDTAPGRGTSIRGNLPVVEVLAL